MTNRLLSGVLLLVLAMTASAEHKDVLMIGNSYSAGTIPKFEAFAQADTNSTINLVRAVAWGKDWAYHYTNRFDNVYDNGMSLSNMLLSAPFDVIILQNQSLGMMKEADIPTEYAWGSNLYNYCMSILTNAANVNRNPDVEIKLFMTWSRQVGVWPLGTGYDRHDMQEDIRTNYNNLAVNLGIKTVPVGNAWERVYDFRPYEAPEWYNIHHTDGTHGNDLGYYLNGAIFYETVYGIDARDAVYIHENVSTDEAAFLRDMAHVTLSETPLNAHAPSTLELSTNRVVVATSATNSVNLRLPEAPSTSVTVQVVQVTGSSVTPLQTNGMVFTAANWDQWQAVNLEGALVYESSDTNNILRCTVDGYSSVYLMAQHYDPSLRIVLSTNMLMVPEGQSAYVLLSLSTAPENPTTVTVQRVNGDSSFSVTSGSELIFTAENYMNWQTSTVAAAQDINQTADSAIIRCSAPGISPAEVAVTEVDDDFEEVFSGLLAAWNLTGVTAEIHATNAYTLASHILTNSTSGVLKVNLIPPAGSAQRAMRLYDQDEISLADSIGASNYFSWALSVPNGYSLTVTGLYVITEINNDGSQITAVVLSDATGFTAGNEILTHVNTNGANSVTSTMLDLSGSSAFQGLEDIEFRLYGYGADSAYDSIYIGDAYNSDYGDAIRIYGSLAAGSASDADRDGLPDDWETQYFGGATNANPLAMAANGINTVEEAYIAGLNPTNPFAAFALSGLQASVLNWNATSGRVYSVYWSSNLTSSFQLIASNLTSGAFADSLHNADNQGFYRINVDIE